MTSPRLGLCCQFSDQPQFKFRTTTAAYLTRLLRLEFAGQTDGETHGSSSALRFYSELVAHNLDTLERVIVWCSEHDVRAFRIGADLWPRATHPLVEPWIERLFSSEEFSSMMTRVKHVAGENGVRLSEHPDQFLVGNSLRPHVVENTIKELEWRGRLGEALGVEVICLHVGTGAPDANSALDRWASTLERLSGAVTSRLAFENDDRVFSPEALLPACMEWGLPMIYDVHHHRVLRDSLSEEDATELSIASWGEREPYFHISSPRDGWDGKNCRAHHDMIDVFDWPAAWLELAESGHCFTVDIEAKAKEKAIAALQSTHRFSTR